jgi:hypothetical protein
MSRRGFHTLLFGLMAVLNGTVMLIGPGLHGLPGCGHGAVASRAEGPVDDGLGVASGPGASGESCPICEYLTQGQVVAERVLISRPVASAPCVPILFPSPPDLRTQRTFGCRAPPAVDLA